MGMYEAKRHLSSTLDDHDDHVFHCNIMHALKVVLFYFVTCKLKANVRSHCVDYAQHNETVSETFSSVVSNGHKP